MNVRTDVRSRGWQSAIIREISHTRAIHQCFKAPVSESQVRLVLVCHRDSWDVDRDIVDVACSEYDLDPPLCLTTLRSPEH